MKTIRRHHMVFWGDLQEHSNREVCRGASEYAAEKSDLDFDPWPSGEGQDRALEPAAVRQADCLLISKPVPRMLRSVRRPKPIPYVFVIANVRPANVPSVEFDEAAIGRMAVEHLVQRGYRQLAFVGSSSLRWSRLRGDGFATAAREQQLPYTRHELPLNQLPVFWSSNLNKRLAILQPLLKGLAKPCGILAANDVIACFLVETGRYYGLGIPTEIGIVGVDDDPIPNAAAGLALSSVQLPFRDAGYRAAEMLDRRRKHQAIPQRLFLPPIRVVARASTDAFMVPDPLVRRAQAYIESHRQGSVLVGEVIQAIRTTPATINKHFSQSLDTTPSEYILRRRLEHAKELLRAGQCSVDEVARAGGFSSCSYFCLVFKKLMGASPGSFRP